MISPLSFRMYSALIVIPSTKMSKDALLDGDLLSQDYSITYNDCRYKYNHF
jgi:hypothetical protein